MDYDDLAGAVKPLVEGFLDHHYLNDTLATDSPTAEAIARWLFDALRERSVPVTSVTIDETCTSRCVYEGPSPAAIP